MQAIVTKYLPATNVKGSRVKATCQAGSLTLHWDHALNTDGNHRAAAEALARKLEWAGKWIGGFDADSRGVFVCSDSQHNANARLIAAAPEMLEALQQIEALVCQRNESTITLNTITQVYLLANAAIAKATGEA